MYVHDLNPIALEIGPLALRWYSLAYIFGLAFSYFYILHLNNKFKLKITDRKDLEEMIFRAMIGMILGGRIGYVLFYNFSYYFSHPLEILFVWQGGMSFHGGIVGVTLGVLYHAKKAQKPFLKFMDLVACASPSGLFFGRIANFINAELYGKITNQNWGVIFPNAGMLARHPSQLYEAALEGLLSFIILYFAIHQKFYRERSGSLAGLFLICYAISRIFVEFFRLPDPQIGYFLGFITMGQILTIPMLILGIYLIYARKKA